MDIRTISVADLRLDGENPRHPATHGEQPIIAALLDEVGPKILALAADIAAKGLSPIDLMMVVQEGTTFTVVEGNRRLASLRLLSNPKLASTPPYVAQFSALAKLVASPITEVLCYVSPSRAAAKQWQALRHNGEDAGRGVVDWDAAAKVRHFGGKKGQTADAVILEDALNAAYPLNKAMLADLKWVVKNNSTTLGRLIGDPDVRDALGVVLRPAFVAHYSSADLEPVFMRLMADMAGPVGVSTLYNKPKRADYLDTLRPLLPDPTKRQAHASPLAALHTPPPALPPTLASGATTAPLGPASAPTPSPAGGSAPGPSPTGTGPAATGSTSTMRPTPPGPNRLFGGVRLPKMSDRVRNVLGEIQRLDVSIYPNASAVLMRVVIDLAISEVFDKNGWPTTKPPKPGKQPESKTLAEKAHECLDKLDPSRKDPKWQAVRVGLKDPNGLFAISTLNAWIHNPHFSPVPRDVLLNGSNYGGFLAALNGLMP